MGYFKAIILYATKYTNSRYPYKYSLKTKLCNENITQTHQEYVEKTHQIIWSQRSNAIKECNKALGSIVNAVFQISWLISIIVYNKGYRCKYKPYCSYNLNINIRSYKIRSWLSWKESCENSINTKVNSKWRQTIDVKMGETLKKIWFLYS